MRRSVLARLISALSTSAVKSGHPAYASRSSPRSAAARALPSPYHPGRLSRACDQANTHGMARRASRLRPAPRPGGARAFGARRAPAAGGPGAEAEAAQLLDGADLREPGSEGVALDQTAVGG